MHPALRRAAIFHGVEPSAARALARRLRRVTFQRGHTIFTEGEPGDRLYIVLSGKVKISCRSATGREAIIAITGPSYFQQLLPQTPLRSGVHLIPQGLGAMLTMPLAGRLMDRDGPRRVVLTGISLMCAGMAVFAYGVWKQHPYTPVLLIGLLAVGMGMGCTMMPLSGAALQTLKPHQVARGSTLINVNQRVAGSVGTALTSVILTHQINRSDVLTTANKLQTLREKAARHGGALDPTQIPPPARRPDFMATAMHDLSHAYTVVFTVVVAVVALAYLPALLLPNEPAPDADRDPAPAAMAH